MNFLNLKKSALVSKKRAIQNAPASPQNLFLFIKLRLKRQERRFCSDFLLLI
jgi:hypothetical protein